MLSFLDMHFVGKYPKLHCCPCFFIKLAAAPLASRGSIFEGIKKGRKKLKTIPRLIYKNKISQNHLRAYAKLPSKGEPYQFSG